MQKILSILSLAILMTITHVAMAQKAETIQLEQTEGAFTQKSLTLEAGKAYIFEVSNKGVDRQLGFVIAPKGKPEQAHHIPEAYLAAAIKKGEVSSSKEVVLEKGEYIYFCPLNPTPQYTLVVK